ncbi:hypothetical protein D3C75_961020 [compost metagenome]
MDAPVHSDFYREKCSLSLIGSAGQRLNRVAQRMHTRILRIASRHAPNAGAVCGSSARTDLCEGQVTAIPTATSSNKSSALFFSLYVEYYSIRRNFVSCSDPIL